jgi:hypothetical protein
LPPPPPAPPRRTPSRPAPPPPPPPHQSPSPKIRQNYQKQPAQLEALADWASMVATEIPAIADIASLFVPNGSNSLDSD